jgi:hypothetical protein
MFIKFNSLKIFQILLFFSSSIFYSQDVIHFKNGNKEDVKVLELNSFEVKYKKFNHLNGPNFISSKSEIDSIRFENGTIENISATINQFIDTVLIRNIAYKDMLKHYQNYRDEMAKVVAGSILLTPIFGLHLSKKFQKIPVKKEEVTYLVKSRAANSSIYEKNPYFSNDLYLECYQSEANKLYKKKIKKSFIVGSFLSAASAVLVGLIFLDL